MFNVDISLCIGKTEEKCKNCLRYRYYLKDIESKTKNYNTYFTTPPMDKNGDCEYFILSKLCI